MISDTLFKLKRSVNEIQKIVEILPGVSAYFVALNDAVQEEALTQEEADMMKNQYKNNVLSEVSTILSEEEFNAEVVGTSSVIEANDKVKNITPTISGSPVIVPPPATYQAENTSLLSAVGSLTAQLNSMLSQINSVVG